MMVGWVLERGFACFCITPLRRYAMVQVNGIFAGEPIPELYSNLIIK
jgi:hypothetical protein